MQNFKMWSNNVSNLWSYRSKQITFRLSTKLLPISVHSDRCGCNVVISRRAAGLLLLSLNCTERQLLLAGLFWN